MDSVITVHSFLLGQSLIKTLLSLFVCMLGERKGKKKKLNDHNRGKACENGVILPVKSY